MGASRVALVVFGVVVLALSVGVVPAFGEPESKRSFAIEPGSFHIVPSTLQAGAHEDLVTSFDFDHSALGRTFNDVRNTVVNLPPGFIGNNTAVPTCTAAELIGNGYGIGKGPQCPPASQVGTIKFIILVNSNAIETMFPVFNMEVTSPGIAAELGFNAASSVVQMLPITVRPGDLGLTVTSPNIVGVSEPHKIVFTVWGVPGAKIHDAERGEECVYFTPEEKIGSSEPDCINGGKTLSSKPVPFLSNPTSCGSTTASMKADSWEQPVEEWSEAMTEIAPVGECERVPFDASIKVLPTTRSAESPSGLDVSLVVPQSWEKAETIATSDLKDAEVTLPVGYTVNPSAGSGLVGCTPQELEAETYSSLPGEGCPPESKIGTVKIETPVLAEKITGSVYIAEPHDNPFDSLLAMYVVAKIPERGIIVKVAGKVEPNPVTGQLVTTFSNNPQVPFSKFTLELRQGATSPLVSPPACGTYTVAAALTPWSAPESPHQLSDSFEIEKGVHGGACPSGGIPPFDPSVITGSENNDAANYSPFYLRITREDGEQEITKFTTIFPPGLTGNLTGIPFCSDAQIEEARRATGQQEIENPSCPLASEIGHTLVGAGVGSVLAWTPGKVYLAGPYHGSALSIVSVTSATVGPFDLGTVVIRFALRINPATAQAEIDSTGSDPIPHIIDGIVVHVRDIHVYIDRSKFILDPTNCQPMRIVNTITGAGANPANPADQTPVTLTTPFQAADCQSLQFKPIFKVSTTGRTSRSRGAGLTVKLTYPNAPQGTQTNIAKVKVDLPKQLPSRLTTLQKACSDKIFEANPAACPPASIVGHAKASTPILPVPITGPAYFVSHGGAKFPELVLVLQGYGITIDLHGETFINKAGITSSTFRAVPDEPIGSFELTLPQGPDSALAANGNLCTNKLNMPTAFTAQNGATINQTTRITVTGCAEHKNTNTKKAKKNKRKK
jgi:hypothetical protein